MCEFPIWQKMYELGKMNGDVNKQSFCGEHAFQLFMVSEKGFIFPFFWRCQASTLRFMYTQVRCKYYFLFVYCRSVFWVLLFYKAPLLNLFAAFIKKIILQWVIWETWRKYFIESNFFINVSWSFLCGNRSFMVFFEPCYKTYVLCVCIGVYLSDGISEVDWITLKCYWKANIINRNVL